MRWALLAGILLGVIASSARADTLVCTDGRRLTGDVTHNGDGTYTVHNRFGTFNVIAADVQEWRKEPAAKPPVTTPAHPATNPPTRPATDMRAVIVADMLTRAGDALAAGDFSSARAMFAEVLEADSNNVRALHGQALACIALDETPRALLLIDKAMDRATANRHQPDRSLVFNFCMIQLASGRPARAVRGSYDYLAAHKDALDEQLLNALAIALSQSDDAFRRQPLFTQAVQLYTQINAQLEHAHPGYRRWGLDWVAQAEYDTLLADQKRTTAALDEIGGRLARARSILADADQAWQNRPPLYHASLRLEKALKDAQAAYDKVLAEYQAYQPLVVRPHFPASLDTVPMDAQPLSQSDAAFAARIEAAKQAREEAQAVQDAAAGPLLPRKPGDPLAPRPVTQPASGAPHLAVPRQPGLRTSNRYAAAFPIAPDLLLAPASTVAGASKLTLTSLSGDAYACQLVRSDTRLALLRVAGANFQPLAVAPVFHGGMVDCITFSSGLFDMKVEKVPGNIRATGAAPILALQRLPRRMGTPLLAANAVVGISLADSGTAGQSLPFITLEQIRAFCGQELPQTAPAPPGPQPIFELTATVVSRDPAAAPRAPAP